MTQKNSIRTFGRVCRSILVEDDGASMVEYAVGVGFIAAAVIAGTAIFSPKLVAAFTRIGAKLDSAQ